MIAISVKQPWAYLICAGIKDIENRTWKCPEKYIGQRVLIHASASSWSWHRVLNYLTEAMAEVFEKMGFNGEWLRNLHTGAIIGSVEIVGCIQNDPSIWAEKYEALAINSQINPLIVTPPIVRVYNWKLANPILFDKPITGVKGKLGFWKYEGGGL